MCSSSLVIYVLSLSRDSDVCWIASRSAIAIQYCLCQLFRFLSLLVFVFFLVRRLLRMADVEGALQATAPEIQVALKADGLATKTTLLDRCSTEVVLGKWFVVRVVKEQKIVGLNEEN